MLVGLLLLSYSVIHVSYMLRGYTRLMGFYGLERNSVDVVFLGTSVTFTSFMPMEAWYEYGIAAYDYCTNVQFENALRYSLADIERTQHPKLIMIDIAPFLYEHFAGNADWEEIERDRYISFNLDSRRYTLDRFALINEINQDRNGSVEDYWYYFFDINRSHMNNLNYSHFHNAEKDVERGYGYLPHQRGEVFMLEDTVANDGRVAPLSGREQYYLEKLLVAAGRTDAEIVFFCAPVYFKDPIELRRKNYLKEYIETEGFTFADFSGDIDEIGLDYRTDFWGVNHFDALGAEKVTMHLCDYITSNHDIPDRRNDEQYSKWHSDYEDWKRIKNDYLEQDRRSCHISDYGEQA